MKKILLSTTFVVSLFASEIQYGHGTMDFKGGFLGLTGTLSEDIDTISFLQNHSNIANSKFFYAYNLSYYSSKHFKAAQKLYNTTKKQITPWILGGATFSTFIPAMDYTIKGMDASLSLGYDLINKNENNYLGLAVYLGINAPTIESKKDMKNTSIPANVNKVQLDKYFLPSKTDITTYKIGASLYSRFAITPSLSIYTNAILAYQKADIENSYAKANFNSHGIYKALDIGLRFQPIEKDYKLLGLTLSPRLYLTSGFKWEQWDIKDVSIDISGMGMKYSPNKMKITSKTTYVGLGYSW